MKFKAERWAKGGSEQRKTKLAVRRTPASLPGAWSLLPSSLLSLPPLPFAVSLSPNFDVPALCSGHPVKTRQDSPRARASCLLE